jgi:hypothetical protein
MEVRINIEKLFQDGLTPNQFVYLCYIAKNEEESCPFKITQEELQDLQSKSYIKIQEGQIILRGIFNEKFQTNRASNEVDWIEEWRNLFPTVKVGGRPAKGSKAGVIKKMLKFIKDNPKVTKEEIFEATKSYIFEKKQKNYDYMQCADYFIEKNGNSTLESFIEHYKEKGGTTLTQMDIKLFHKEI